MTNVPAMIVLPNVQLTSNLMEYMLSALGNATASRFLLHSNGENSTHTTSLDVRMLRLGATFTSIANKTILPGFLS